MLSLFRFLITILSHTHTHTYRSLKHSNR